MSRVSDKMRARLLAQREKMNALAEQERAVVRDHVRGWLQTSGDADLVDCPSVDQVIRRVHRKWALDLPDNWETRIPRYARDAGRQNAWARDASAPAFEFSVEHLRPLARMLVQVRMVRSARRGAR